MTTRLSRRTSRHPAAVNTDRSTQSRHLRTRKASLGAMAKYFNALVDSEPHSEANLLIKKAELSASYQARVCASLLALDRTIYWPNWPEN